MEHGDPIFHYGEHAKPNPEASTQSNPNNNGVPHLRARDKHMPSANVIRIMRQALPRHAKIDDNAKEAIQHCTSRFIGFITNEANKRCQREYRKIVTAEDLLWAMGNLGFNDYIGPLNIFLHRYRHIEGNRSVPLEEPNVNQGIDNDGLGFGPGPSPGPEVAIGMPQPTLPTPHASYGSDFPVDPNMNMGMFDPTPMDGFYGDGSGLDFMENFDPFADFKYDRK